MTNPAFADDLERVKSAVLEILDESQTMEQIGTFVDAIAGLRSVSLSNLQREVLIAQIESSRIWKMGLGVELVSKEHKPWLESRQGEIEWTRWGLYERYLRTKKGINPGMLESMDRRNSRVLDLAGDPKEVGSWSRKGLVIGDVQSGKTSNYLALFNKAADAGYRIFILLAGDKERLRAQTQERVDEGFVGRDSKSFDTAAAGVHSNLKVIGVGDSPDFSPVNSLTSYFHDFDRGRAGQSQNLNDSEVAYVFVIKKHKSIMNNLAAFLEAAAGPSKKLKAPLLLVDDEADYASIDTSKPESDPTAINSAIRRLLGSFERSSYVGVTATPFANVLISDDDDQDLFPRDFIYALDSPSNYFGPAQMFDEQSVSQNFIVPLQDGEDYFPFKHRKNLIIDQLPRSLDEAILAYFVSNAVRDLRPGQETSARSMMVHVSRFKDVQRQVFQLVNDRCAEIKSTLKLGIGAPALYTQLEDVFKTHFAYVSERWEDVKSTLAKSAQSTQVFIVNSDKINSDWITAFDGPNPRVIAVGGDVLSRGLTLEGLSISYFYRRSLAYDTVMQTGRWFGYRDGYRDLCKLWIDAEVSTWFLEIAEALTELREQLENMHSTRETPESYGLAVKCHPGAVLTVTSINKMRAGKKQPIKVNLWGMNRETIRFSNNSIHFKENDSAVTRLVEALNLGEFAPLVSAKNSWRKVPQALISDFVRSYIAPPTDLVFGGSEFAKFVSNPAISSLKEWDVLLQSGSGEPLRLAGLTVSSMRRSFAAGRGNENTIIVGMGKSRLGSMGDVKMALSENGLANAANEVRPPSADLYASHLDRPLLILYPIEAVEKDLSNKNLICAIPDNDTGIVWGYGVAFPAQTGGNADGPEYVINSVFQRNNSTHFDLADFEEGDDV